MSNHFQLQWERKLLEGGGAWSEAGGMALQGRVLAGSRRHLPLGFAEDLLKGVFKGCGQARKPC